MHLGVAVAEGRARQHQWDFSPYYVAALAMREGINPYATDLRPLGQQLGLEGIARATDTPFFPLRFEPLTWLRPAPAYGIWLAISAAALALAMGLIMRRAAARLGADNRAMRDHFALPTALESYLLCADAGRNPVAGRGHDGLAGIRARSKGGPSTRGRGPVESCFRRRLRDISCCGADGTCSGGWRSDC
jgi:hypothetical protein